MMAAAMKDLDALMPRPLAYLARHLLIAVPLAAFIAAFFAVAFNDRYATNFVYSLCIGLICQFVIDLGRRGAAWALRRGGHDGGAFGRGSWPGWPITLGIVGLGVWAGVSGGYALAGYLLGMSTPTPSLQNPRTLFVVVTVCVLASMAFTIVSWARARLAATEAQAQRAQRAAAENQLMLLQSQLEPHMLFNTLANLRVLIGMDPPRAQAMLDRLIAFLRATLEASREGGLHALATEFERVADYLALMQVRMGPRLAVSFHLPDDLRETPVPPLLLQPLVENGIRHGLEPKLEGGRIEVSAAREGDALVLVVSDSGVGLDPSRAAAGTRFGTQQVRERLATLYGGRAGFVLEPAPGGGTLARVTLPLDDRR
jgi:signal transduction histidine kinase